MKPNTTKHCGCQCKELWLKSKFEKNFTYESKQKKPVEVKEIFTVVKYNNNNNNNNFILRG